MAFCKLYNKQTARVNDFETSPNECGWYRISRKAKKSQLSLGTRGHRVRGWVRLRIIEELSMFIEVVSDVFLEANLKDCV